MWQVELIGELVSSLCKGSVQITLNQLIFNNIKNK